MIFDIMTLFPDMIRLVTDESIIGRAKDKGIIEVNTFNIRDYTKDKHKRVDDYPYGGGHGMIMQCQPIYDCYKHITRDCSSKPHTVYMSPKGAVLTQKRALELSKLQRIVILCGHYEGVDQRILDEIIDEEISIGDYVLTGGELPACVLIDCVSRMIDGVLSDSEGFQNESHFNGYLEYPQYTRPEVWKNRCVPQTLLSGHHANIEKWKEQQSLELTKQLRPDLIKKTES